MHIYIGILNESYGIFRTFIISLQNDTCKLKTSCKTP